MKLSRKEFEQIFDLYYNPLCNYCRSLKFEALDEEDIVQDVFVNLWNKNSFSKDFNFKSYLFTSVRHRAIDVIRRRNMSDEKMRKLSNFQPPIVNEDDIPDKYLLAEFLFNQIRQLPPKCQRIFIMSKVNGLTYSEIAKELGISAKTVENQIGRAYQLLRKNLGIDKQP